ncbi:hypothetical protein DXC92_19060 [Clostridiales bacterium TF09-2AC]|nr:hypothetical protein DXC92_19060 [Clostridiales bacterium TF09-2AC]
MVFGKDKGKENMKKTNRIMMVQGMVNTLVDSIKEYENFENRNGYPPMYGNAEQYNTKESIRRRIVQARAELNQLAKEL